MFLSQSDYDFMFWMVVLCLVPIPCLLVAAWGWQRNVPPRVKEAVKRGAKATAKAAIKSQLEHFRK